MSSEHSKYLARQDYEIPHDMELTGITSDELLIIKKYGHWMDALERKTIFPTTQAQRDFLSVCYGQEKPITQFEVAWRKLKDAVALTIQKKEARLRAEAKAKRDAREEYESTRRIDQERNAQRSEPQSSTGGSWMPRSERERPNTWNTCPVCSGDGGAKGECFKCSGTGWV